MSNTVTTYSFKDIAPEDYKQDEVTPNQKARTNTILYGTPDIDVLEHVTDEAGITRTFTHIANPDGTTKRVEVSPSTQAKGGK